MSFPLSLSKFLISLSFFFSFLDCPHGIWKFLGQGSNLSWSCDLCHSRSNAGSLTTAPGWGSRCFLFVCFVGLFYFLLFRAPPMAYGGSQARGQVRATTAGLLHSHSNAGSEPPLRPTPQLKAMPDP